MRIKKSNIKVLKEKTHTEFSEIKSEKKQENLEEEVEEQNHESFVDFSVSKRTAPVLEAQRINQETSFPFSNAQQRRTDDNKSDVYEAAKVYNMPNYGSKYDNEEKKVDVRRSTEPGLGRGSVSLNNLGSQSRQNTWQQPEQREISRQYEVKPASFAEDRRLPFSRAETKRRQQI